MSKNLIISIETKPNGASNNWLELGRFEKDNFGDEVWKPNPNPRYPNHDKRLEIKRSWSGNRGGASEKIQWAIIIPVNYPLTLVQRWGDGDKKILYAPQSLEQLQKAAIEQIEEWLDA